MRESLGSDFKIRVQYLKSVSVVSPNVPMIILTKRPYPKVDIHCDVSARKTSMQNMYEVELSVGADALMEPTDQDKTDENCKKNDDGKVIAFQCRVRYCGIVDLSQASVGPDNEITQEQLNKTLLIDAPYYLFPDVRCIIARTTQDLGGAPLMVDPIDFAGQFKDHLNKGGKVPSVAEGPSAKQTNSASSQSSKDAYDNLDPGNIG